MKYVLNSSYGAKEIFVKSHFIILLTSSTKIVEPDGYLSNFDYLSIDNSKNINHAECES